MADLIDRAALRATLNGYDRWPKGLGEVLAIVNDHPPAPSPALTREALAAEIAAMGPATPFELADAILSALMEQRQ